ncbi:DUF655 domain-containing protein [Halobacteriales archaeon SW_7_68_16]|nr:MAG: DUF655 domain-containing protein [Halobacteriales archaeon SW_7_68_16]
MTGDGHADGRPAVVLDVLPHGRSDDDRPQYQKEPLAYAVGVERFDLFELVFDAAPDDLSIGDRIDIDETDARLRTVDHDDLSGGARSELEYVVEDIVDDETDRFVGFYNDAQPITLRMHRLDLLRGIGTKLRNAIIDERKRGPFEDFEDLEERVDSLHDPKGIIATRIMEEVTEDDLKYRAFVGGEDETGR